MNFWYFCEKTPLDIFIPFMLSYCYKVLLHVNAFNKNRSKGVELSV